jgi:hypothetical protein
MREGGRRRVQRATALLVLAAGACVSLERAPADKRRFLLEARRSEAAPPAADGRLVVAPFHMQAPYAGGGFVHRRAGGEVVADFHHEFFIPPGVLIADLSRRWLADAGLFAAVTTESSRLPATHLLEADVLALCVEERPPGPRAVLEIEAIVLEADRRLVHHARHAAEEPLPDLRPETIVSAWNRCVTTVLGSLEQGLRQGLTGR